MAIPLLLLLSVLLCLPHESTSFAVPNIRLPLPRSETTGEAQTVVSVTDYGASGDGINYDTEPIQAAIDDCSSSGGGRVRFPEGSYLTGTIFLKSGVVLDVEEGATILGAAEEDRYPSDRLRWYAVVAENATDVGITGRGQINGQSSAFVEEFDPRKNIMRSWNQTGKCLGDECRPWLVGFIDSKNIRIWDISLRDCAYWCLHLVRSEKTVIHDVWIKGDFDTPNNDGIDIEDSNNTYITRCHIDTGDDGICPKSASGPVVNLTATNSIIRSKSSAIKFGSGTVYNFENFRFDNITIFDSHRGIGFQLRDGGNISNVVFSNIKISTRYYHPSWWGRAEPIYMTSCRREENSGAGSISDVQFINITSSSENGLFLSGTEDGLLQNIKLTNANFTFKRWTNFQDGWVDYRPGCRGLVRHRTAGMILEHISGMEMENVRMRWSPLDLKGWNNPIDFTPSTVNKITFKNFQSDIY
ncbi:hypothetical protein H6P81_010232 [Aristolochia fimbriata]|uniref:Uncharacterized protein n=1 Tax=Aristolochia fimbriata TaxID=158543 RepID=A0AAV7ERL2_ARIFI|nr:hypothetical protein H6P81_010232 [Aristolochia fimbriata]